jgi:hypothetical protein
MQDFSFFMANIGSERRWIDMAKHNMDILKYTEKAKKSKDALLHLQDIKRSNIAKEAKSLKVIDEAINATSFIIDTFEKANYDALQVIELSGFERIISPISVVASFEPLILNIKENAIKTQDMIVESQNNLLAATPLISAFATTASLIISEPISISVFPSGKEILEKYNPLHKLTDDIEYLKLQFSMIEPNISVDFEHFINTFYAFKTNPALYQEIMGARSMFYFKLMFPYVEKHYGKQDCRFRDIWKFTFGNYRGSTHLLESPVNIAKDIYNEISNQKNQSIKLGNVDSNYVEDIFVRLIGTMAALLKLRESYYIL